MALQTSGAISMNDINVELGNSGTATISLNDTEVRSLLGVASGAISLNDAYGASSTLIGNGPYAVGTRWASSYQELEYQSPGQGYMLTGFGCADLQTAHFYQRLYITTANSPIVGAMYAESNPTILSATTTINNPSNQYRLFSMNNTGVKFSGSSDAFSIAPRIVDRPGYPTANHHRGISAAGMSGKIDQFEGARTQFARNPGDSANPFSTNVDHRNIIYNQPQNQAPDSAVNFAWINNGNLYYGFKSMITDSPNSFGKSFYFGFERSSNATQQADFVPNSPGHIERYSTHYPGRPTAQNTNVGVNRPIWGFNNTWIVTQPAAQGSGSVTQDNTLMDFHISPIPSGREPGWLAGSQTPLSPYNAYDLTRDDNAKGYWDVYFKTPYKWHNDPTCTSINPATNTSFPYAPFGLQNVMQGARVASWGFTIQVPSPSDPYVVPQMKPQFTIRNDLQAQAGFPTTQPADMEWLGTNASATVHNLIHNYVCWDLTPNFNWHFWGNFPNNVNSGTVIEYALKTKGDPAPYGPGTIQWRGFRLDKYSPTEIRYYAATLDGDPHPSGPQFYNTNGPWNNMLLVNRIVIDPATGEVQMNNPQVDQVPTGVPGVLGGRTIYTPDGFYTGVYTP